MPRHARALKHGNGAIDVVVHVLEVADARIVVVLAREESAREIGRVRVGERVVVRVPPPEANVEPADARAVIVDDDDFLVVGPKLDIICRIRILAALNDIMSGKHLWSRYDPGGACTQCSGEAPRVLSRYNGGGCARI